MNDGWKCPECGRVYAPSVLQCEECSNTVPRAWPIGDSLPFRPMQSGDPPPLQQTWITC
jgi:hypothetical protein